MPQPSFLIETRARTACYSTAHGNPRNQAGREGDRDSLGPGDDESTEIESWEPELVYRGKPRARFRRGTVFGTDLLRSTHRPCWFTAVNHGHEPTAALIHVRSAHPGRVDESVDGNSHARRQLVRSRIAYLERLSCSRLRIRAMAVTRTRSEAVFSARSTIATAAA